MTKLCPMIIAKYYGPHHVGLCDNNRIPLCHALIHEDDFSVLFGASAWRLVKDSVDAVKIKIEIIGAKP